MKRFKTGTPGRQFIDALDPRRVGGWVLPLRPVGVKTRQGDDLVEEGIGKHDLVKSVEGETSGAEYTIVEKRNELRYTLGPMYAPEVLDAHDEWTDEEAIRKAVWAFNERGSQELRKQHGRERIGVIREFFQWPFDHEVDLKRPDGKVTKTVTLPAGTAYVGVQWSKEAWPLVKSGKITGYSMGGRAVRVRGEGDMQKLRKFS